MPIFSTTTHPGVARIAIFDTDAHCANATSQVLLDQGYVPRTVLTPAAVRQIVTEWRPHVVVLGHDSAGLLRAVRAEGESTQIVAIGDGVPDRRHLAAFGVHAWCGRDEGPERLLATVESAIRRQREVAGLLQQRAGLQSILETAPQLNQLRSTDEFARVAMAMFARTVDPDCSAPSGVFAIQTHRPRAVQYFGIGRYEDIRSDFDLPPLALAAMARALQDGHPVNNGPAGFVVAVPAQDQAKAVLFLEGLEIHAELDDLCSVYASLVGQALTNILLFERATVDGLTGLYNRAFGLQRLVETLSLGARHPSATSVMVLDVDHFKNVNDQHGHAAGDAVLMGIAATIHQCCRETDIAVRLGGEEFLVVLPRTDEPSGRIAAERLRNAVGAWRGVYDGVDLSAQISVGVASAEAGDRDAMRLLERADDALYVAKREGRNRVVCAG